MRFRIQIPPDQSSFASSPEHFGGYTVFLRLCMPSHPPYTLSSLTTLTVNRSTRCLAPDYHHGALVSKLRESFIFRLVQRRMKIHDLGLLPESNYGRFTMG